VQDKISEDFFLVWFTALLNRTVPGELDDDEEVSYLNFRSRLYHALEDGLWKENEIAIKLKEQKGFNSFSLLAQEVIYQNSKRIVLEEAADYLHLRGLFDEEDEDKYPDGAPMDKYLEVLGGWEKIKKMFQMKISHQLDVRIFKRLEEGGGGSVGGSGGGGGGGGSGVGPGGSGRPSQGGGKSGGGGKRSRPY